MELHHNRWFVKLFFWSVRIWDSFSEQNLFYRVQERTNLCFFARVIVVWMPLALLANIAMWAMVIYVLIWMPIELFGFVSYLTFLGALCAIVGAFTLLIYIESRSKKGRFEDVALFEVPKNTSRGPSAIDVFLTWIKAKKSKICPIVTFSNKEVI